MGVSGLHKLLQPYSTKKHVSDYKGLTLGVDGYAWLHRAAASCADDLFHGRETTKLVQSIDNRIRLYEYHGVELYFVFDGTSLSMKSEIESQRRAKRKQAQAAHKAGKQSSYQNSLSGLEITAQHAAMVIALLKQRQIKYVVAPFEADSQLVWLEKEGFVQGIISEDSDMLVFGAQRLLTKSDPQSGNCVELHAPNFPKHYQNLQFLRALAIISGCDYCSGVYGLGPVKAGNMLLKMNGSLDAAMESLARDQRVEIKIIDTAKKADIAFQYQRVWDVQRKALTHLNSLDALSDQPELLEMVTEEVVGRELTRAEAHRIAVGMVDPHNLDNELVVSPLVAQYVNRCRPFAVPKPKALSSPLAVSRAIDRRLSAPTVDSKKSSQKSSPFFSKKSIQELPSQANKENDLYQAKIANTVSPENGINRTASKPSRKAFFHSSLLKSSVASTTSPITAAADISITAIPPLPASDNDTSFNSLDSTLLSSSPSHSVVSDSFTRARPSLTITDADPLHTPKRQRTLDDNLETKTEAEERANKSDTMDQQFTSQGNAYVSESSEPEEAYENRFAFLKKFRFTGSMSSV